VRYQAFEKDQSRVTPGTGLQAQQCCAAEADLAGSQTGNTPGTMGHRTNRFCSRCSLLEKLPGTATALAVTGCSPCSRCDPAIRQVQSYNCTRLIASDVYLSHAMACGTCRAHLPISPTHRPAGPERRMQGAPQTTQHNPPTLETPHV
jgi:hypothetical protein